MSVNTYKVLVQRDTYTTTPTIATEYEIKILKELHGKGHVLNEEGKSVDEKLGDVYGTFNPSPDEYQRLVRRYGSEIVAEAIGKEENLKRILNPRSARKAKMAEEATAE